MLIYFLYKILKYQYFDNLVRHALLTEKSTKYQNKNITENYFLI